MAFYYNILFCSLGSGEFIRKKLTSNSQVIFFGDSKDKERKSKNKTYNEFNFEKNYSIDSIFSKYLFVDIVDDKELILDIIDSLTGYYFLKKVGSSELAVIESSEIEKLYKEETNYHNRDLTNKIVKITKGPYKNICCKCMKNTNKNVVVKMKMFNNEINAKISINDILVV